MKASLDVKHLQDPADGVAGQAQSEGGIDRSPAAARNISPNVFLCFCLLVGKTKVKKSNRVLSFFRRAWKAVKAKFQRNRETGDSSQPNPEIFDVPDPRDPERISRLQDRLEKCALEWTPVTEVWPNVFIGNVKTARDPARLEEMNITHLLNAAPELEDETSKNIWEKVYKDMNITSHRLAAADDGWFDVTKHFFPAADFIHKALSKAQNKVLVCCLQGVSRSATLFLAYLMIHCKKTPEDSIDLVTQKRFIRPNGDFLRKLTILAEQRNLVESDAAKNRSNPAVDKPDPEVESVDSEELYVCEPYGLEPVTMISHLHVPESFSKLDESALEPDPEPVCVPGPSGYKPKPKAVDSGELWVSDPSGPKPEPQTAEKISLLHLHFTKNISDLDKQQKKERKPWTPIASVLDNLHIGSQKIAMNKVKLKRRGITHVLNTLPNVASQDALRKKQAKLYKKMDISYHRVFSRDEDPLELTSLVLPVVEHIHKILSSPKNQLLVHCEQGLGRSCFFVVAYLMIYHEKTMTDAIDVVKQWKRIRMNRDFLTQLVVFACHHKQQQQTGLTAECSTVNINHPQIISRMQQRFLKHSQYWTPVSEAWPNVFIADEKTARNKAKLKEMNITHIVNAMPLCSKEKKWEDYYQKKNITYYNVHSRVLDRPNIAQHFSPAAAFIQKALSDTKSKVLVYCSEGIDQSVVLLMAYLMIHQDMKLEDAFEFVLEKRSMWISRDYLNQLMMLNLDLAKLRKLKSCKPCCKACYEAIMRLNQM
ncbi:uncharacterized protein LOC130243825 [Danio aesculapii]|uniref:uncharacterized protein LOC130243825 n=1 Tax=Danio aesculapii TaxID=1142201 RepID=UPI0024BFFB00|nr:uncharacterized protein LOC130243825 [Danio aesculapii]